MTPRRRLVLVSLLLVAVGTTRAPAPSAPAIEIHRTATATFTDLGKLSPIFVLVMGSDVREGDPRTGRSDSLHIVAINPSKHRGTIVGIPRDSYVPIPGRGVSKINAALAAGGPERVVQTVTQLSGIPIHYWAIVEFSRFRKLVDAVGGVDVNVPYPMVDHFSGANFSPGKVHMDGGQALAFARTRKSIPGGDFGRSMNQGRLLISALDQFRSVVHSPIALAPYLAAYYSFVVSDVSIGELLRLSAIAGTINPHLVDNVVAPGGSGSAGGSSVVFLAPGARQIFDKIRDDGIL